MCGCVFYTDCAGQIANIRKMTNLPLNNNINSETVVKLKTSGMRLMKMELCLCSIFQQHQCCNELLRN